jgi:predicted porin
LGAFAGAAQAQSSVSVYGIMDAGLQSSKLEENTATVKTVTSGQGSNSSTGDMSAGAMASSRLGFRGVEDMGGGMTAMFNLEYGIAPGTGTTTTAAIRTSVVGIGSKQFGMLQIGRQLTGMHGILAGDVFGGSNMAGDITYSAFASTAAGAGPTANGRINADTTRGSNMITYTAPVIAGLALRADYSNNTGTAANTPGIQNGIAGAYATYTQGPFSVKAGQIRQKANAAIAATTAWSNTELKVNGANAMYKAKGLTIQYTVGNNITETKTATTTVHTSSVRAQKLGLSYQVTPVIMPFVQYGIGGTEGVRTGASTRTDDKAMQVGAIYTLSKRTNLYAAYGDSQRELKSNSALKTKETEMAVGLLHTF